MHATDIYCRFMDGLTVSHACIKAFQITHNISITLKIHRNLSFSLPRLLCRPSETAGCRGKGEKKKRWRVGEGREGRMCLGCSGGTRNGNMFVEDRRSCMRQTATKLPFSSNCIHILQLQNTVVGSIRFKSCPHWLIRRKGRQFVAQFGDSRPKRRQSPNSAIVSEFGDSENGDCRRIAEFGDCSQCGQGFKNYTGTVLSRTIRNGTKLWEKRTGMFYLQNCLLALVCNQPVERRLSWIMDTRWYYSRYRRLLMWSHVWSWYSPPSVRSPSNLSVSRSMELTTSCRCTAVVNRSALLLTSLKWLCRSLHSTTRGVHWSFKCSQWRLAYLVPLPVSP